MVRKLGLVVAWTSIVASIVLVANGLMPVVRAIWPAASPTGLDGYGFVTILAAMELVLGGHALVIVLNLPAAQSAAPDRQHGTEATPPRP